MKLAAEVTEALCRDTTTVADAVAFYDKVIEMIVENDRLLIDTILKSPTCTDDMRRACGRWGATVEIIVEAALFNSFGPGKNTL